MKKVRPPKTVTVRLADTRHKLKKEDDDIMREKIKIDRQLKENNRGVYGIFLIRCDDLDEQCAYIGKSEQLAYLIIWRFYFIRPTLKIALCLAILSTLIFLISGVLLRHWLLVVAAVLFGIGHIYITVQNHK